MTDAAARTPVATDIPVPAAILAIAESKERQLVWCFFVFFSRMEYALKRRSYLKSGTKDAQPNWDTFGSQWDQRFNPEASEELKTAVEYFIKEPPRKQRCDGNTMQWSDPQWYDPKKQRRLCWLLNMIRCVRNNLFHGGKFPIIAISEPSRDRELITHSLTILQSVLELDAEVKREFFEDIA